MALTFKKTARESLSKLPVYIEDTSTYSPKYFRVSDVPQVLTKGKNLIRVTAHPTNLVEGSRVYVDVVDTNGNPIYFEIPDYLENDKSRVISIWIYHDKGSDNTPNGEAIITLVSTANVGLNGEAIPARFANKPNVRWSTAVNVDRNRKNISPILFKEADYPQVTVSESIEVYKNLPYEGDALSKVTESGSSARYIYKGSTPIVQLTVGSDTESFNSEMIGYELRMSNFTNRRPATTLSNPISNTSYTASIVSLLDATTAIVSTPYSTSFENRVDLKHTFTDFDSADYTISYFTTASNVTTENKRSMATFSFSNVDPIAGLVDKLKFLIKSDGLDSEYELINEVTVPFSSSFTVKIPIPSEHLEDAKKIKIQYLNSIGEISRIETVTDSVIFQGGNTYIAGRENMISGSLFISNTLRNGIEIAGARSGYIRSVGYEGLTSASLGLSPGGFLIYSGSSNLQIGADIYNGVGIEFVGANDDRHFIFETRDGGLLDIKTDTFFIGNSASQFISGATNNIEISSSLFHLDPKNNVLVIGSNAVINADLTVNSLRTPALINGVSSSVENASASIEPDGFAKFVSASIGGFDVSNNTIQTSVQVGANPAIRLSSNGIISGSSLYIRQNITGSEYVYIDTDRGIIDAKNNGRHIETCYLELSASRDSNTVGVTLSSTPCSFIWHGLKHENTLNVSMLQKFEKDNDATAYAPIYYELYYATTGSSSTSYANYDNPWNTIISGSILDFLGSTTSSDRFTGSKAWVNKDVMQIQLDGAFAPHQDKLLRLDLYVGAQVAIGATTGSTTIMAYAKDIALNAGRQIGSLFNLPIPTPPA